MFVILDSIFIIFVDSLLSITTLETVISSSRKQSHQHHGLVKGSITKLGKIPMKHGVNAISSSKLLKALKKERVEHFEEPWSHVLPEDIGSCYEIIMEIEIVSSKENCKLVQRKDRRKSGIHHTPFDLTEHMCELAISESNYSDVDDSEFLTIDIAHGAGAFTLQMARKISKLVNIDIKKSLTEYVLGFDIDNEVLAVASFCFHIEANFPVSPLYYNLYKLDTLDGVKSQKSIRNKISKMVDINSAKIVVIGNPPYVEVKLEEYKGNEILKKSIDKKIFSNGGRVLNIVIKSKEFKDARDKALNILKEIDWTNGFYRKDIAYKVIDE